MLPAAARLLPPVLIARPALTRPPPPRSFGEDKDDMYDQLHSAFPQNTYPQARAAAAGRRAAAAEGAHSLPIHPTFPVQVVVPPGGGVVVSAGKQLVRWAVGRSMPQLAHAGGWLTPPLRFACRRSSTTAATLRPSRRPSLTPTAPARPCPTLRQARGRALFLITTAACTAGPWHRRPVRSRPPLRCTLPAGIGLPLPVLPPYTQMLFLAAGGSAEDRADEGTPASAAAQIIDVSGRAVRVPSVVWPVAVLAIYGRIGPSDGTSRPPPCS